MKTKDQQVAEMIKELAHLTGWKIVLAKNSNNDVVGVFLGSKAYIDKVMSGKSKDGKNPTYH